MAVLPQLHEADQSVEANSNFTYRYEPEDRDHKPAASEGLRNHNGFRLHVKVADLGASGRTEPIPRGPLLDPWTESIHWLNSAPMDYSDRSASNESAR